MALALCPSMQTSCLNRSSLLISSSPCRSLPGRISARDFLGNKKKLFLRLKLPTEFQSLYSQRSNGPSCLLETDVISKLQSSLQVSAWSHLEEIQNERSISNAMALEKSQAILQSSDSLVTLGSYNGLLESIASTERTERTEKDSGFKTSNSKGIMFSIAENVEDVSTVRVKKLSETDTGLIKGKLRGCSGTTPCVSTSAFQSPSRFLPPWTGAQVVAEDGERYIYVTLEYDGPEDTDDMEFLFTVKLVILDANNCVHRSKIARACYSPTSDWLSMFYGSDFNPRGKIVCFRSVSRKSVPDPPFCWWKGCINGPRNRSRLEAIRDDLGWTPLETDEEKEWVPLLLH